MTQTRDAWLKLDREGFRVYDCSVGECKRINALLGNLKYLESPQLQGNIDE